jgi:hypothetical protein
MRPSSIIKHILPPLKYGVEFQHNARMSTAPSACASFAAVCCPLPSTVIRPQQPVLLQLLLLRLWPVQRYILACLSHVRPKTQSTLFEVFICAVSCCFVPTCHV